MDILFVVDSPKDWPEEIPGVEIVPARHYLTDPRYGRRRGVRVQNLCRSYQYQSLGYYVSLLATARGHRPLPSVSSIQDMKSLTMLRFWSQELDDLIQKSLSHIQTNKFTLSIYFGKNVAKHYDRLSMSLFRQFPAPLLRAKMVRTPGGKWLLQSLRPVAVSDIPDEHWPSVIFFAAEFFEKGRHRSPRRPVTRYDLAILCNPAEKYPPSNEKALRKFQRAAEKLGFYVETIGREDYGRLAEFDALFIRETTNVHHHTYRFAQRAAAEGLVVIDDPDSILLCTNKVFLAELLARHGIAMPRTLIVHRNNTEEIEREIGFPCILKQPDSSFSQGVFKAEGREEMGRALEQLFARSELAIAQEFLPTEYDWRVGILDRKPLYVCKYHMAPRQWKIQHTDGRGRTQYGEVDQVALEQAPPQVVHTALKAANLIGDGLYGVDLKQTGGKVYIIEINDNPSLDAGFEDGLLKDGLYQKVMEVFLARIEERKKRGGRQ